MVLTQADGRTLSGTITGPSVNETISGGGEDTDIIYALTGTFTFSA